MNLARLRKGLLMLAAGALAPVVVTCRPPPIDGVVQVFTDGYYYDDCWDCGDDHSFWFDFWDYDH